MKFVFSLTGQWSETNFSRSFLPPPCPCYFSLPLSLPSVSSLSPDCPFLSLALYVLSQTLHTCSSCHTLCSAWCLVMCLFALYSFSLYLKQLQLDFDISSDLLQQQLLLNERTNKQTKVRTMLLIPDSFCMTMADKMRVQVLMTFIGTCFSLWADYDAVCRLGGSFLDCPRRLENYTNAFLQDAWSRCGCW